MFLGIIPICDQPLDLICLIHLCKLWNNISLQNLVTLTTFGAPAMIGIIKGLIVITQLEEICKEQAILIFKIFITLSISKHYVKL